MSIYNQKLIQLIDDTIHDFFPDVNHINISKCDDIIIVEFKHKNRYFRKDILENAKSKKLRDIKKTLIHELKCFDIPIKNENEKGNY